VGRGGSGPALCRFGLCFEPRSDLHCRDADGNPWREAFIFVFLPGVLLALLSPFIWLGKRSAMLLAFMVAVVVQVMIFDSDHMDWRIVLPLPVLFGALTLAGVLGGSRLAPPAAPPPPGVWVEVFAALVYFTGVLAVFMAPFNHSRHFGWAGISLYAALIGVATGTLSLLIWQRGIVAMIAAFGLALVHWFVLGSIEPALWRNIPHIAAAVVSGVLALLCIAAAATERLAAPARNGDEPRAPAASGR
jgi:hypothetical protein